MAQACKEKKCVDCGKPYTPTSNVQKRCVECGEKHQPYKKRKPAVAPEAVAAVSAVAVKRQLPAIAKGGDQVLGGLIARIMQDIPVVDTVTLKAGQFTVTISKTN